MTAAELYAVSADFRALLHLWEVERHCPPPLVDFLLEQGLEGPAECCRWASRPWDLTTWADGRRKGTVRAGIYPMVDGEGQYYWFTNPDESLMSWGHDLVADDLVDAKTDTVYGKSPTVTAALLWLLDRWKIPDSVGA